jgi:multiple sugar transport system substrate-binding protein
VVLPAIPASTDKAEAAFKAKGVDMSGFLVQVKDKTTFLFPITDHAADVTASRLRPCRGT